MNAHNNFFKSGLVLVFFWAVLSPIQITRAYEPFAHRIIVGRAIRLYNQFGSSGEPNLYTPIIKDGAENEDDWTDDHVFCYTVMHVTMPHFWDADGGVDDLVNMLSDTWPNAWMKASGYRVNEFGICRGNREGLWPQAISHYRIGHKDVAYELLGHVAHLIADMSVPAHVHEHKHIVLDRYEDLVSEGMWWLLEGLDPAQLSLGLIPIPQAPSIPECGWPSNFPLWYLMYTTNQRADFFASVNDDCVGPLFCEGTEEWGDPYDFKGWVNYFEYPFQMGVYQDPDYIDTDLWVCNNCGQLLCIGGDMYLCWYCLSPYVAALEPSYLIAERCTLVYAVRATATLFELFVNATEATPPTTTLHISNPKYHDGNDWHIAAYTQLTLTATDDKSGVNCTSYRISGNGYDSGWFIYTAPFDLSSGPEGTVLNEGRYVIHFISADRAGNVEAVKQEEVILGCVYNTTRNKYYTSIQAAIDDAVNGDEILAGPTTYNEAIDFKGKAIALRSSHGPEMTTINGAGHYRVVQCISGEDANTVLEGFTITDGNATYGGGMLNLSSSPTVTGCNFTGNKASFSGGGMYNVDNNATVNNCTFINNTASQYGGGIYYRACYGLSNLTKCTFSGNTANSGGAIYNDWYSHPIMTNCSFSNNNATTKGGAIANTTNCYPKLSNCIFNENTAGQDGGGLSNAGEGPGTTLTNCTFRNNTATGRGGGIFNHACYDKSILTNCIFIANQADWGGAIYNNHYSYPRVTNCTFSGNTANAGGGIYNSNNSSPAVTNCILWGNTPDEILDVNSNTNVTYSDVQGGWPDSNNTNINSPPLFANLDCGKLQLSFYSPCVDSGRNDAVPLEVTMDLGGEPRFVDDAGVPDTGEGTAPIVDMGAYELQSDSRASITIHVPADYNTIQDAIESAHPGDEVIVSLGCYNEAIDLLGKAITLRSIDPNDTSVVAMTIIDATGLGAVSVVKCQTCEGHDTILSGFTIRSGSGTPSGTHTYGGGMYNIGSSPTVTHCHFTGNSVDYGGGMYNKSSSPTVNNCTFTVNRTTLGGGMSNFDSNPLVTSCVFKNNSAQGGYGGGMYNSANSIPRVINCSFYGNWGGYGGGGVRNEDSNAVLTNCTFNGNGAAYWGQGISNDSSTPTVSNCILWGDSGGGGEIYGTATVTYSNVQDGWGGAGGNNIDTDPCFVDAGGGDLRLRPGSLCIDAGDNGASNLPSTDILDNPRIVDGDCNSVATVDMGAYEFALAYFGDFDNNCRIDFFDFSIFGRAWETKEGDPDWDWACDISDPPDNYIDWRDAAILCDNWLAQIP